MALIERQTPTDFNVSRLQFCANMNYVHCIVGNDEEEVEDNDDVVMYLNF